MMTGDLEQAVAELMVEVRGLVEEVTAMRTEQAEEVRTRRLVVVDEDGREQAEMTTTAGGGTVNVVTAGDLNDCRARASLAALDEDGADAGVWLYANDTIVADFQTIAHDDGSSDAYMTLQRDACGHGHLDYIAELRGDGISMMEHRAAHPLLCARCPDLDD